MLAILLAITGGFIFGMLSVVFLVGIILLFVKGR